MYKIYVRPHLEYCVQAWNPVYSGDIKLMEKVQDRFTKMLRHGPVLSPRERNEILNITDHRTRRLRGDLIHIYKLLSYESLFTPVRDPRTRGHDKKLEVPQARNNIRGHSFAARNIAAWNRLPNNVVNSRNLDVFKANIDEFLQI